MIALRDVINRDLSKVVGMRAAQHLLKVPEVAHHRDHVILNIAKIESDFAARGDGVLLIASLGEALDHIRLPAQETHQAHDSLTTLADLAEEGSIIVGTCNEDLVLNHFRLLFGVVDDWTKGVHDVVAFVN